MKKKSEKKAINLRISKRVLKDLNHHLVDKHGNVFGHVGESIENAIILWLEDQKGVKSGGS